MVEFLTNPKFISFVIATAIAGAYLWFVFSIIYHFIRFGIGGKPKVLALVFLVGSFVLILISTIAYSQVDWEELLGGILDNINP